MGKRKSEHFVDQLQVMMTGEASHVKDRLVRKQRREGGYSRGMVCFCTRPIEMARGKKMHVSER